MRQQRQIVIILCVIPVVAQPHVVPHLMREDRATTSLTSKAEGTAELRDAGNVANFKFALVVEKQMHEVGAGPSAHGAHSVHVAILRIPETLKIDGRIARLRIPHLGPVYQRHAVVHSARRVGFVRLGDHQVDLCPNRGGTTRCLPRRRCIDDRHINRHVRLHPAQRPREGNRSYPGLPVCWRTHLGHPDIQETKT